MEYGSLWGPYWQLHAFLVYIANNIAADKVICTANDI